MSNPVTSEAALTKTVAIRVALGTDVLSNPMFILFIIDPWLKPVTLSDLKELNAFWYKGVSCVSICVARVLKAVDDEFNKSFVKLD